jgi:transposase InsO family protein
VNGGIPRGSITEVSGAVTGPNQLWCMDFKGYFATGDGKRCDPFTITDAHSRYLIRCQIVSRIDLSQVRAICEAAMREYGVPARIGPTTAHRLRAQAYWGCQNCLSGG